MLLLQEAGNKLKAELRQAPAPSAPAAGGAAAAAAPDALAGFRPFRPHAKKPQPKKPHPTMESDTDDEEDRPFSPLESDSGSGSETQSETQSVNQSGTESESGSESEHEEPQEPQDSGYVLQRVSGNVGNSAYIIPCGSATFGRQVAARIRVDSIFISRVVGVFTNTNTNTNSSKLYFTPQTTATNALTLIENHGNGITRTYSLSAGTTYEVIAGDVLRIGGNAGVAYRVALC